MRVDREPVLTSSVRRAGDLRDYGETPVDLDALEDAADEGAADDGVVPQDGAYRQPAIGGQDSEPGTGAGPTG